LNKFLLILFLTVSLGNTALASDNEPGLFENWFNAMERTVKAPTSYDLYRPLRVVHMRFNFTKEQIARYNEDPGGIGVGMSRIEGYNEHSLYAMGFRDSHSRVQGVLGYGWYHKLLKPGSLFNVSYGFTISGQMRHEYSYIPIPLPLPLLSADFGPFSAQAAYVPGGPGWGNIAIFWLKVRIPIGAKPPEPLTERHEEGEKQDGSEKS